VDQAGATMDEVVSSIKRVTDIMAEISAASNEQSLSVGQVGEAIGSIDQTTQQNAALVEEMAMKSCVAFSEVFLALVLSQVFGLCLFCCAQVFLSVLVISKLRKMELEKFQNQFKKNKIKINWFKVCLNNHLINLAQGRPK